MRIRDNEYYECAYCGEYVLLYTALELAAGSTHTLKRVAAHNAACAPYLAEQREQLGVDEQGEAILYAIGRLRHVASANEKKA